MEPMRARPVPFCFQSFLPDPETRQRFLVACVPARCPARYCFTASQSRSSLIAPKTSSASSSVPTFLPLKSCMSIVAMVVLSNAGEGARATLSLLRCPLGRLQWIDRRCAGKSTTLSRRMLCFGNHKIAALRPGHAAFNHQQVVVLIHAKHAQIANGDAFITHVSRHAH